MKKLVVKGIVFAVFCPVLIFAQTFTFDGNNVQQSTCDHQRGFTGRCIKLIDCPYANGIFKYLEHVRSTAQLLEPKVVDSYHDYLKKSHCGWQRKHPKVCCDPLPRIDSCPVPQIDVRNRISEGTEAGIAEFPHMALLINEKVRGRPAFYCGGALINERYVLTAAHCFFEPHLYDMVFIRLGEHDLNSDIDCRNGTDGTGRTDCSDHVVEVNIEEKFIHERFEQINYHHDIALIRLAAPVNYTRFIQPICLLDSDTEPANLTNKLFEVSGFGKMGLNVSFSNVKLKVALNAVSQEACQAKYATLKPSKTLINQQFCAGGKGRKDTCHGDSGSPMIGRYVITYQDQRNPRNQAIVEYKYLAGIVSYGLSKCGTPSWPGIYTRVSNYVDWIRSKMRP